MNLEYYIARRIQFGNEKSNRFSAPAISIAMVGIALGIAVMLISVMIVTGFKNQVSDKITGFGAHIRVTNFDNNISYESVPIEDDKNIVDSILQIDGVKNIRRYSTKPGILKTKKDFQGVVLKGLSTDYPRTYFSEYIKEGSFIKIDSLKRNDSLVISNQLAKELNLKVGDPIGIYFFQDKLKVRRFEISGLYETHFVEFDKLFVFVDQKHIQELNAWSPEQITGYEIRIEDMSKLDIATEQVFYITSETLRNDGNALKTESIKQVYPQIFSWLSVIDTNVWIILFLMITVAGFNMVSGVLILILEKARMIGIVKSIGMQNWSIRKVFLYQTFFLAGRGMLWGNIIGITFYILQVQFGLISLNPENYYVTKVPVEFSIISWLLLNIGSVICIIAMMIIPSVIITKINPAKVVSFE